MNGTALNGGPIVTEHEIDTGIRCGEHVGEVFPPRCAECDALRREDDDARG